MKRFITLWAALFALAGAGAQTAEVFRSEFVPFDTRDDAALLRRGNIAHYETFSPQIVVQQADTTTVGQVVEVPLLLTDRDIYLHLENVGSAYTLLVNDTRVADVEDDRTPREFLISPYIRPGRNAVMLDLRPSKTPQLQADAPAPRLAYANSYLVFQHRLHIDDYSVALVPDSTRKYGVLKLDIVVENSYNGEEPITAGYDIYDPKGKLLDYGSREIMVEGLISPYIRPGRNAVMLDLRPSKTPQLQADAPAPRLAYANSYLVFQHRLHIDDYSVALVPDSTRKYGVLKLDIVVENSYNGEEPITAGYDIYDPKGKLLDYGSREIMVEGRSRDTVHIERLIYHAYANQWDDKRQPLYKVTLYTKRNSMLWEYIPLYVGFGESEYRDGRFYRFDKELSLRPQRYNAAADEKTTAAEMKALKARGINTLLPDYPQPYWFYTLADRTGFYVVDCAAIYAPDARDDRSVGGTPSNDPRLTDEYLGRVKAMYHRSRNHTSIIGFALGRDSGNGYNMYKAYQWLKSVEPSKPVFYVGADGEWNSDAIPFRVQ